jgi:hypothetical protein
VAAVVRSTRRVHIAHVPGKGLSDRHRRRAERHLERITGACGFCTLRDLAREPFERWLVPPGDAGAGAWARNCYRDDLVNSRQSGRDRRERIPADWS